MSTLSLKCTVTSQSIFYQHGSHQVLFGCPQAKDNQLCYHYAGVCHQSPSSIPLLCFLVPPLLFVHLLCLETARTYFHLNDKHRVS